MIIERKNCTIELNGKYAIKTYKNKDDIRALNDKWLSCYKLLQEQCPNITKVYEVNGREQSIVMENLGVIETGYKKFSKGSITKDFIINTIITVNNCWSKMLKFSQTLPFKNKYFIHCDYTLSNIVYTADQTIKIIDPDSFCFINDIATKGDRQQAKKYIETMTFLHKLSVHPQNLEYR